MLSSFFIKSATADCVLPTDLKQIPPDKREAYKKALLIVDQQPINKGTDKYYQELYDSSKYIYIGRVSIVLSKNEQLADRNKIDSKLAYVTVSKGWKNGKVKKIKLKIPDEQESCEQLYSYNLKAKSTYLFFESHKKLITALPLDKKLDFDNYGADGLSYLGKSDWYYSRNSTIHYSNK